MEKKHLPRQNNSDDLSPIPLTFRGGSKTLIAIADSVTLGEGAFIWNFTTIGAETVIGDNVVIGSNCYIGARCRIGNNVRIQHGVFIPNGAILGDNVFIGPNATFTDDKHPIACNTEYRAEPPYLKAYASVGAGAVVLPGITLGTGCIVGAGAVVTRDVDDWTTVAGVPARPIGVGLESGRELQREMLAASYERLRGMGWPAEDLPKEDSA